MADIFGAPNILGTTGDDNGILFPALVGTSGDDIIWGFAGNDVLYGLEGNDVLYGGDPYSTYNDSDTLYGGMGDDVLIGGNGTGSDVLDGGEGNDTYYIRNLTDIISENPVTGGGIDEIRAFLIQSGTVELGSGIENLDIVTSNPVSLNVVGNNLDNVITDYVYDSKLSGLEGDDTLFGNIGNDQLFGGVGNDKLHGGLGLDALTGGAGNDVFYFDVRSRPLLNLDTITDFSVIDDTIGLSKLVFTSFTALGAIAADNFVSGKGAKAHDANDFLTYNTTNGALTYDANGNAAGGTLKLAILVGVPHLTADDFLIV